MKKILVMGILCASMNLAACSVLPIDTGKPVQTTQRQPETQKETEETKKETEETPSPVQTEAVKAESVAAPSPVEEEDMEAEIHDALFRSTASAVQMEITTGKTTEYLDSFCNYPIRVVKGEKETMINDLKDLEKIGLKELYTDSLLKAVEAADPETMEIEDGMAVLGDPDTAYVVLGKDENGIIGIAEFHYVK